MARRAFSTRIGEVAGPISEGRGFLLMMVEERLPAEEGEWYAIAEAVEASLEAEPIGDYEYVQWVEAMRRRYEVDVSPFLKLVGERVERDGPVQK